MEKHKAKVESLEQKISFLEKSPGAQLLAATPAVAAAFASGSSPMISPIASAEIASSPRS